MVYRNPIYLISKLFVLLIHVALLYYKGRTVSTTGSPTCVPFHAPWSPNLGGKLAQDIPRLKLLRYPFESGHKVSRTESNTD